MTNELTPTLYCYTEGCGVLTVAIKLFDAESRLFDAESEPREYRCPACGEPLERGRDQTTLMLERERLEGSPVAWETLGQPSGRP
jgi:hypothetical protein